MKSADNNVGMQKSPAVLMTLPEVFNNRLFAIPDYQRGYAWEKSQIQALHKDIEQLFDAEQLHFTGTIVLTKNELESLKHKSYGDVYDIIDGQQRLTTLFILLHELIDGLEPGKKKSEWYQSFIGRGEEGNQTQVFKLNSQINPFFRSFIINKGKVEGNFEYFSEQRIALCKELSNQWITTMNEKHGKAAIDLLEVVTQKLGFIVYQPEDPSEAGMMFEVINNRGKPLSELEKVKNYLLYFAIKQNKSALRETIDDSWGKILKNLAAAYKLQNLDENTFLRGVSVAFFGLNKKDSSKVYDKLKQRFPVDGDNPDDWKSLQKFVEFMVNCSAYYDALLNEKSSYRQKLDKDVIEYIELIRSQSGYANILPLYFAIMDKRDCLEKSKLLLVLKALEITNFRVYMTRNGARRTDSGQGDLYAMAHGFYTSFDHEWWLKHSSKYDEVAYEDNVAVLISRLRYLVNDICPDASFIDGLSLDEEDNFDFYHWKGIRYFLMNYESDINSKRTVKIDRILRGRKTGKSNDYWSIEHIWASAHKLKKKFKNGEDDLQKKRLGNFMLLELGINIQAADKKIKEKVGIYLGENSSHDKSELKQVDNVIRDYAAAKRESDENHPNRKGKNYQFGIYQSLIDKNEQRFVDFAEKRWSLQWAEQYYQNEVEEAVAL